MTKEQIREILDTTLISGMAIEGIDEAAEKIAAIIDEIYLKDRGKTYEINVLIRENKFLHDLIDRSRLLNDRIEKQDKRIEHLEDILQDHLERRR
jgi:hypothetical protein